MTIKQMLIGLPPHTRRNGEALIPVAMQDSARLLRQRKLSGALSALSHAALAMEQSPDREVREAWEIAIRETTRRVLDGDTLADPGNADAGGTIDELFTLVR